MQKTNDLAAMLAAYAEGTLDPETTMEVDGLIAWYVDGKLDHETAQQIEAAMHASEAVARVVAENIDAARLVREQLVPALRALAVPVSPKLRQYVEDLIADPDAWGTPPDDARSSAGKHG